MLPIDRLPWETGAEFQILFEKITFPDSEETINATIFSKWSDHRTKTPNIFFEILSLLLVVPVFLLPEAKPSGPRTV